MTPFSIRINHIARGCMVLHLYHYDSKDEKFLFHSESLFIDPFRLGIFATISITSSKIPDVYPRGKVGFFL